MRSPARKVWAIAFGLVFCAAFSGCGTPGAPQPPSLNLPNLVMDLSAKRTGNQVTLTWTQPKRHTDKTLIKDNVAVHICYREGDGQCSPAAPVQMIAPSVAGSYTGTMPAALVSGAPRPVSYFVELRNRRGRSAGLSNSATILGGEAPARIEGLKTEVRKQGVVLSWTPNEESTAVRLDRRLLTPQARSQAGPLAPAPEPVNQSLLVDSVDRDAHAIDRTVHFGESYEYRAQRVIRVDANGRTLELDGAFSDPVEVDAKDVFPPSVPTGLVAVATAGENGLAPAIDLSWQPSGDPDVAGYIVYRREASGEWQRVSPATPVVEPAFHDLQIQPGHTYAYAVSALDRGGHESAKSGEATETVPQP